MEMFLKFPLGQGSGHVSFGVCNDENSCQRFSPFTGELPMDPDPVDRFHSALVFRNFETKESI